MLCMYMYVSIYFVLKEKEDVTQADAQAAVTRCHKMFFLIQ